MPCGSLIWVRSHQVSFFDFCMVLNLSDHIMSFGLWLLTKPVRRLGAVREVPLTKNTVLFFWPPFPTPCPLDWNIILAVYCGKPSNSRSIQLNLCALTDTNAAWCSFSSGTDHVFMIGTRSKYREQLMLSVLIDPDVLGFITGFGKENRTEHLAHHPALFKELSSAVWLITIRQ